MHLLTSKRKKDNNKLTSKKVLDDLQTHYHCPPEGSCVFHQTMSPVMYIFGNCLLSSSTIYLSGQFSGGASHSSTRVWKVGQNVLQLQIKQGNHS